MKTKQFIDLELHEELEINETTKVLRVNNGLIYMFYVNFISPSNLVSTNLVKI